jgi:hypothetical protein
VSISESFVRCRVIAERLQNRFEIAHRDALAQQVLEDLFAARPA